MQFKNSSITLDQKAVDASGTIEGYASVFGVVDSYGEIVERGAFIDSLAGARRNGRKIKMLYQHDPSMPIGVWDDLAEDSKGLYVKGRLLVEKSPKAAEVHGLLQEGALDGLSIGYRTIKAEPKEGRPGIMSLLKLDLYENSIVTFAANERARVESVKSIASPADIEEFFRSAGMSGREAKRMASAAWGARRADDDDADLNEIARLFSAHSKALTGSV